MGDIMGLDRLVLIGYYGRARKGGCMNLPWFPALILSHSFLFISQAGARRECASVPSNIISHNEWGASPILEAGHKAMCPYNPHRPSSPG